MIYDTSNRTVKAIAGSLQIHLNTASKVIDKLLDVGYIAIVLLSLFAFKLSRFLEEMFSQVHSLLITLLR